MNLSSRTFRCPNCNEMINDQMTQCRYCAVPVDPGVAQLMAERQDKANQAVSDASFLRTATIGAWVFLALTFVPFFPLMAEVAFIIVTLIAIVLAIRWQVKFSNLLTSDPDYTAARKSALISLLLAIAAAPVGFIVRPLVFFFVLRMR